MIIPKTVKSDFIYITLFTHSSSPTLIRPTVIDFTGVWAAKTKLDTVCAQGAHSRGGDQEDSLKETKQNKNKNTEDSIHATRGQPRLWQSPEDDRKGFQERKESRSQQEPGSWGVGMGYLGSPWGRFVVLVVQWRLPGVGRGGLRQEER